MSEVATINPQQIVPSDPQMAVIGMIERAARDPSIDLEKMERLLAWREREQERANRRAFNAAIAAAKAELPVIVKNQQMSAGAGRTQYKYEDMATIARTVDPVLAKHGVYYRFRTSGTATHLTVTCILSHEDGHFEENSLTAPNDTSGSKNAVQAIGSTQTYLQRYTLKSALGLAASADDDGNAASQNGHVDTISEEQVVRIADLLKDTKSNFDLFLKYFNIETLPALPAKDFDRAITALEGKKKKGAV